MNVADQRRDPESLLNWLHRAIRARKEFPEFGTGPWEPVATGTHHALALRYGSDDGAALVVHNLSGEPRRARVRTGSKVEEVFANRRYDAPGPASLELDPYGYRWLRVGRP